MGGFFRLSYTPVMHGLLVFDRSTCRVVVLGLANWSTLAFAVAWVVATMAMDAAGLGFFVVALLGAIYAIQARGDGPSTTATQPNSRSIRSR